MRNSIEDIFTKIFETLDAEKELSITEMAQKSKINNVTIAKYLDLIQFIQNQKKIEVKKYSNIHIVKYTAKE
ncbi:MAG: hypothetical protein ACTSXK_06900 [Promethearchaeota archaeon]